MNDYIKVSNPSIWMVLAALFILLAVVFVWGFTGSLPTTVHIEGVAADGNVSCYVNTQDADKIDVGQMAVATGNGESEYKGQVAAIGDIPMSPKEIAFELNSDYLVENMTDGEFAVKTTLALDNYDLADGTLLDISIVTDSVRPIDFLLK